MEFQHIHLFYLNIDLLVIVLSLSGGAGLGAQMERLREGAGVWERSAGSTRPLTCSSGNLHFLAEH